MTVSLGSEETEQTKIYLLLINYENENWESIDFNTVQITLFTAIFILTGCKKAVEWSGQNVLVTIKAKR